MIDRVGDHHSFGRNLNAFFERGHIGLLQRDALANIFEVGHAVTHRAFAPGEEEIDTLLDVTETILENIFIHPESSARAADRVPPRSPRSK
jgi:hypothetical protein